MFTRYSQHTPQFGLRAYSDTSRTNSIARLWNKFPARYYRSKIPIGDKPRDRRKEQNKNENLPHATDTPFHSDPPSRVGLLPKAKRYQNFSFISEDFICGPGYGSNVIPLIAGGAEVFKGIGSGLLNTWYLLLPRFRNGLPKKGDFSSLEFQRPFIIRKDSMVGTLQNLMHSSSPVHISQNETYLASTSILK